MKRDFSSDLRQLFVLSDVNGSELQRLFLLASNGKAKKFYRLLWRLEMLRESAILVSFPIRFCSSNALCPSNSRNSDQRTGAGENRFMDGHGWRTGCSEASLFLNACPYSSDFLAHGLASPLLSQRPENLLMIPRLPLSISAVAARLSGSVLWFRLGTANRPCVLMRAPTILCDLC